jgi:hypothetical protein
MKNAVFWDVALCSFCVNRRFGGMYRVHLQGRKNPRARNQREQVGADWLSLGTETGYSKSLEENVGKHLKLGHDSFIRH